jgi:heme-degrading monooxygenase HmoA
MNIVPSAAEPRIIALNLFETRPDAQTELVERIRAAGMSAVDVPGLDRMHLLRSTDGRFVMNHMQWASPDAFRAYVSGSALIAATKDDVHRLIVGRGPVGWEIVPVR